MKTTHKIILIPVLMIISGCSYQGNLAPDDSDPYEQSNRGFFEFNEDLDEAILEPVADTYDVVVPEIAQSGFINFMKNACLLYTSPSPRDATLSRMPSSA